MDNKIVTDILDVNGCTVKDEAGTPLAILREECGHVNVERLPACSIGSYMYILGYLRELGFDVK